MTEEMGLHSPTAHGYANGDGTKPLPVFGNPLPAARTLGAAPPWMALDWKEGGEAIVELAMLKAHQVSDPPGYNLSRPNCVLRWARIPAAHRGAIDIVVHLHGFSGRGEMKLSNKAAASGLDLESPGVRGPILGIVPHGQAFDGTPKDQPPKSVDGFRFPAIADGAGLRKLVDASLAELAKQIGPGAGPLSAGRITLTAHSGGGAAITKLLGSLAAEPGAIAGAHYFDGTYGGAAAITATDGWLDRVLARDAATVSRLTDNEIRARLMRLEGSCLRLQFIDGTGTAATAIAVDAFIRDRLDKLVADPVVRAWLRRYYRAQKVTRPTAIYHGVVPKTFGGKLLADPADDCAGDAANLPAPVSAKAHGFGAMAFATPSQRLGLPARPSGAPTGSAFIKSLGSVRGVDRERKIFEQISAGNVPDFLRDYVPVQVETSDLDSREHRIIYYVTRDYVSIGTNDDYVRIPVDPVTAQAIADKAGALLPTAQMVDQIYAAAELTLPPLPRSYWKTAPDKQASSEAYLEHSTALDAERAKLGGKLTQLAAGHKKDVVISTHYIDGKGKPRVAFYGWYNSKGIPIEANPESPAERKTRPVERGLPVLAHEPWYADYAHGIRLVAPMMTVDGREIAVAEVLRHHVLWRLLERQGPIPEPRYTLDRKGKKVAAGAATFALDGVAEGLGYGATWDARFQTVIQGFASGFMALPVKIAGAMVSVHPPYLMNVPAIGSASDCPATPTSVTQARLCAALRERAAAAAPLRAMLNALPNIVRVGKGTPEQIRNFLQQAVDAGHVRSSLGLSADPDAAACRNFLIKFGIGIDCSGFVSQILNKLAAEAGSTSRLDVGNTNSSAMKGGAPGFTRVASPAELRPGDTMQLPGHIRILSRTERRGGNIHFCTAESKAGPGSIASPGHVGPHQAFWRLVPDSRATERDFAGWRLETGPSFDAAESSWSRAATQAHTYGHWNPLVAALAAAGVTPVALASVDEDFADEDYAHGYATLTAARVGPAIEDILRANSAIPVTFTQSGKTVTLAAHSPYVINRTTSPSYKRAELKRPGLLTNAALKRVYDGLPVRAKVGKSLPEDVRAMVQGALNAGAVPGQGPGLTEAMVKDFLSDLGVGVDCSGLVCQALDHLMVEAGRSERISTSSAYLRGGSGGNPKSFDVVTAPRNLLPGDTMWKEGHIRILTRVQAVGSGIEFTTAESSSIGLVGPVAKEWRFPDAAHFSGGEVKRAGVWKAHGEANRFSRYKPLVLALGGTAAPLDAPTPAPAPGVFPPNPPPPAAKPTPAPAPKPAPTPAPVTTSPGPLLLSQADIDVLSRIAFRNAADINACFKRTAEGSFAPWFNAHLGGKAPFLRKRTGKPDIKITAATSSVAKGHFDAFWDQIAAAYDRKSVSALEFGTMMAISLNETGGDMAQNAEKVGTSGHPGIAYAFDAIKGLKSSYNTSSSSRTAGTLFNDPDFIAAHGTKSPGSTLANHGDDWSRVWHGDAYPQTLFKTGETDPDTAFIREADFYKFRGRGVIQTTHRGGYLPAIRFVKAYKGSDATLQRYAKAWAGKADHDIATTSSNADWNAIFDAPEMLARGLALHANLYKDDYRIMSTDPAILLDVPTNRKLNGQAGSIFAMGRRISGSGTYGSGAYRDRVIALYRAMLAIP